jgi:hypothetical protein
MTPEQTQISDRGNPVSSAHNHRLSARTRSIERLRRPDLTVEVLMVIWLATATWLDRSFGLLRRDLRQTRQIALSGGLKMSPLGAAIFSGGILFMAAFWVYKFYK